MPLKCHSVVSALCYHIPINIHVKLITIVLCIRFVGYILVTFGEMCLEIFFLIDRKQLHPRPKCKGTALQYELSGERKSVVDWCHFYFMFLQSLYKVIRLEDTCISSAPLSFSVFKCGSNQWLGILG